mgnify:CR=1 FL=1
MLDSGWYRPEVVVIGSSNVWSYVDPAHPRLRQSDGRPAFNFGLPGLHIDEVPDIAKGLLAPYLPVVF